MKKRFSLLLVLILCFVLVACGESGSGGQDADDAAGSSDKFDLHQEWRRVSDGMTISFDTDGGCVYNGHEYQYEYNEQRNMVSIFFSYTINLNVVKDGGRYTLTAQDSVFVPSADYEELHAAYMEDYVAELVAGKTELVEGNAYTTANGLTFTFDKADLIQNGDKCDFSLYVTCADDLAMYSTTYKAHNGTIGFGMMTESQSGDGIHFVGGRVLDKADLEEDADTFGFLFLSIDGTAYYVPIDTFLA